MDEVHEPPIGRGFLVFSKKVPTNQDLIAGRGPFLGIDPMHCNGSI